MGGQASTRVRPVRSTRAGTSRSPMPVAQAGPSSRKKGHVRAQPGGQCVQGFGAQPLVAGVVIEKAQHGRAVRAAPAQARAVRDALVHAHLEVRGESRGLAEGTPGLVYEVLLRRKVQAGAVERQAGPGFGRGHLQGVGRFGQGKEQGVQLVKAVRPHAGDAQAEVDLGRCGEGGGVHGVVGVALVCHRDCMVVRGSLPASRALVLVAYPESVSWAWVPGKPPPDRVACP